MAKIYGELENAQLEVTTSNASGGTTGRITWNKTNGQAYIDDATNVYAILRNDLKIIIGNNGTSSANVRLHRNTTATLQILTGDDTTAEGSTSTSIGQLDTKIINYTTGTRPSATTANKGHLIYNTSTESLQFDNGTEWKEIGSGGGALVVSDIMRGEDIPTGGVPVYFHEKDYIEITASNQNIPITSGGTDYTAAVAAGTYLFDTESNQDTFVAALQTAIDAQSISGNTITASFSNSTRKFTFSGSGNFDIEWNTRSTNSIAATLGYSSAADDLSATSHAADNTIDTSGTGLSSQVFAYQAHADYYYASRGFFGLDQDGGSQYSNGSYRMGQATTSGTNGSLSIGTQYIARAAITITSGSTDDLDFKEDGGSEQTATLTAGTYTYPYNTLMTELKTQLEATGAGTYTCTYDPDTDKVTIAVSSGASTFQFITDGTNAATDCAGILGFTSNPSAAASNTSDTAIKYKGRLVSATSDEYVVASKEAGFALGSTNFFSLRKSGDFYENIVTVPGDWLADPSSEEKDFSAEVAFGSQAENSAGYGIRCVTEIGTAGSEVYRIQYKQGHGANWRDASTTIQVSDTTAGFNENLSGGYFYLIKCAVDENNKGVIGLTYFDNANYSGNGAAMAYYSNDLDTWTKATGPDTNGALAGNATDNNICTSIAIRESVCIITTRSSTDGAGLFYSIDSGSGYTSFTGITPTNMTLTPTLSFIQYFPAEAGVNQYRYVMIGTTPTNTRVQIYYCKKDGTGAATISEANTFAAANTSFLLGADRDRRGTGNRIFAFGYNATSNVIYEVETNEAYNGGTLTTDNHTNHDISPDNTLAPDTYNGYTSASTDRLFLNLSKRAVLVGSFGYALIGLNAGQELHLAYTTSITGGTWSSIVLKDDGASDLAFEYCMEYISSMNKIVVAFKNSDGTANNLTKGTIYAALINIGDDGVPVLETSFAQVDGGESLASFQGFLQISSSTNSACLSWEHYNGSSRDVVWTNRLV